MSPDKHSRLASALAMVLAGAGLVSTTQHTRAADKHWTSTAATAWWNDAGNWWTAGMPGNGDNAFVINRGSTFQTINYRNPSGASTLLGSLTLNAESTGDLLFVMRMDTQHPLRTSSTAIGSTDWVTFRQEAGLFETGNNFQLGFGGTNGKANYELLNGATLRNFGDAFIGGAARAEFVQMGNSRHQIDGDFYLSSPSLNVQNVYQMNGGTLTSRYMHVAEFGNGSFSHGFGHVGVAESLYIGTKPGTQGYYDMWTGTTLNTFRLFVGEQGVGTFNQRGGTTNVTFLSVGNKAGSDGGYNLNNGTLNAQTTFLGSAGRGTFVQQDGLHTTGLLRIGGNGEGTYHKGWGTLSVLDHMSVGYVNKGAFYQSTGNVTVAAELLVGENGSATGTYGMSGGNLSAGSATIGVRGNGTMTMSGGNATFSNMLALGAGSLANGRLFINGGILTAQTISVGSSNLGTGAITQTGGFVRSNDVMYIGDAAGTKGSYTLSGGSLSTVHIYVGSTGQGTFTQTGGEHHVLGVMSVGIASPTNGTYHMQGGLLRSPVIQVVSLWNQTGGNATGDYTHGPGHLKLSGDGVYTARRYNFDGLIEITGGTMRLDDGAGRNLPPSRVRQLSIISGAGRFDLTDDALIVDHSPAINPLPALANNVRTGFNGGNWDGWGIVTSKFDDNHGVGFGPSTAIAPGGSFQGAPVDDSAVILAWARYGDANLDGVVNLADFNALASNFGQTGRGWWQGDFNYDGIVNLTDFNRLASNFGLSAGPNGPTPDDWAALGNAIPEPATGLMLVMCPLLQRRRRR